MAVEVKLVFNICNFRSNKIVMNKKYTLNTAVYRATAARKLSI